MRLLLAGVVAALALAGCTGFGGCGGAQGSGGQAGVCNDTDHFAYGLQGVKNGSETFRWQNNGNAATVQWGAQGAGTASLSIHDAAGKSVFQGSFSGGQAGAQQRTSNGQPGAWTITLTFGGFSGQGGVYINRA